ncbi:type IV toxin-antitoxin system AbiEi family antitoxin domain-containing protein [Phytoactinopolyspora halotolerans]|uniref:Type IV toxin-antitoxin system AbiEi family antitoxin domain-containing protein n=1 Tax=Phytoactinopolyspora halotolerans TaxID=1981512 RepID=A0A6L9S3E0_9ACTN|nr:type IV toxin-antitoxin system AbiEi family antitoxin domain-containing protein [Phytoactinopolyspora halotolerans]NED99934.1 type IV toxin-antitoxin system AbiEi family antitoxin domain-containing protein [Phytoactinopolyspora halotolerans]
MSAPLTRLPAQIEDALAADGGLLTVARMREVGITRPRLGRLVRAELLVRLAKGVYASREQYETAPPWPAFALRSRAFTQACGPSACAAGWSAVAIRGLPAIGPPPDKPLVAVERAVGSANTAFGEIRAVTLPAEDRTLVDGCATTTDARLAVDLARTSSVDAALVVADAVLASGTTVEQLSRVLDTQNGWSGTRNARWVIEHADAYAESALETLGRLAFLEHDLPVPISNAWVDLGADRFRPDHLLDDRWLVFEGDGDLKYNDRLDAARVIGDQREREWRLREYGLEIVRYGWSDARHHRRRLAERFRAVIAARVPRDRPCPWYRENRTYRRVA